MDQWLWKGCVGGVACVGPITGAAARPNAGSVAVCPAGPAPDAFRGLHPMPSPLEVIEVPRGFGRGWGVQVLPLAARGTLPTNLNCKSGCLRNKSFFFPISPPGLPSLHQVSLVPKLTVNVFPQPSRNVMKFQFQTATIPSSVIG